MRDVITIDRTIGEMATNKTIEIDKIIEGMTPDKETGVKVGIGQEITVMTVPKLDRNRDRDRWVQPRSRTLSDDRGGSRSRFNSSMNTNRDALRCYRCGEYAHFAQECPNMPADNEMGGSDSEQASLQMLTQDSLSLNSNGEVEYLNL